MYGLRLYPNGFMEFLVDLDYFNHNQDEEKFAASPILYPFAVVEFPLSFVRTYAEVSKFIVPMPESIEIVAGFFSIKNSRLYAGHPQGMAYGYAPYITPPFPDDRLLVEPPIKTAPNFEPDSVAFRLIREIYKRYGHPADHIPFFDQEKNTFNVS